VQYFIDCVAQGTPSMITGEDGRIALEAIYAAYHSAGIGQVVSLPLEPADRAANPIDLWLSPAR
jgi:myo-inositol 2-dehydrogenase / D-chiro-inositol 1-dehydrogenase